jgi:cold shock CspA family protein
MHDTKRFTDTRLVAFLSTQGVEPTCVQLVQQGNTSRVVYEFAVDDRFRHLHDAFFSNAPVSLSASALLKKHSNIMYEAKKLKLEAGLTRPIMVGVVQRFNSERDWGFVRCTESLEDVFLHVRDVVDGGIPREGDAVSFEIVQTAKGAKALNVRILKGANN